MINLLPPDVKQNIAYARYNTKLVRWVIAFMAAIAGISVVVIIGLAYMRQSVNAYTVQIAKTEDQLKVQKLDETQAKVEEISTSLKLVLQVLGQEVLFSKLIKQVGATIPANATLTNLKISKTDGAIDLTAATTDYNTATQVQVNLQDPANKIFDKADIVNITCGAVSVTNPKYPCNVTIRAQFAKSNPFLFINTSGAN